MNFGAIALAQVSRRSDRVTQAWEQNQKKVGKIYRCVIDRKKGDYFVGRTEIDSPDVDNEVLIDAKKHYLKLGYFLDVKILDATDFDLYGVPIKINPFGNKKTLLSLS